MFEMSDFEETRPGWVPLFKPHRLTLASILVGDRCRDCGTTSVSTVQGSVAVVGIYTLCDACAALDDCRASTRGPEWHTSHWGDTHPASQHDELVQARERRRDIYRRRSVKGRAA